MIKKVAGGYKVLSGDGKKNLGGPYKTKKEAEKAAKASGVLQTPQQLNSRCPQVAGHSGALLQ